LTLGKRTLVYWAFYEYYFFFVLKIHVNKCCIYTFDYPSFLYCEYGQCRRFVLVCLIIHRSPEQFFSYPSDVTIAEDRIAYLDLCLAFLAFSSDSSVTWHTYCDINISPYSFIRKDRSPSPTTGFEPKT
jgi:hypothetical protein